MSSRFAVVAVMLVAGAVCALTPVSCKTSCSDNDSKLEDQVWDGGYINPERTAYASGPWNGKFLEFKPEKTYLFRHCLRGAPNIVQVYVGFQEEPLRFNRSIAEAAGNEAIIEQIDDQYVAVRNDTCQKFWVRIAASDPWPPGEGGAGGAPATSGNGGEAGADPCVAMLAEAEALLPPPKDNAASAQAGAGDLGQGGAASDLGQGGAAP